MQSLLDAENIFNEKVMFKLVVSNIKVVVKR